MGHSTCQGASVFGGGPTHRQRRTCDRCDRCPGCDPSVGRLKSDGEGGYYCTQCVAELKARPAPAPTIDGEYRTHEGCGYPHAGHCADEPYAPFPHLPEPGPTTDVPFPDHDDDGRERFPAPVGAMDGGICYVLGCGAPSVPYSCYCLTHKRPDAPFTTTDPIPGGGSA